MQELTGAQRKYLRVLAHHLEPLILVGKQGVSEALIAAADDALESHELIKVKFNDFKDEKREIVDTLVERTGCAVCTVIGHVAVLYRPHEDPEKRHITLPERGA